MSDLNLVMAAPSLGPEVKTYEDPNELFEHLANPTTPLRDVPTWLRELIDRPIVKRPTAEQRVRALCPVRHVEPEA